MGIKDIENVASMCCSVLYTAVSSYILKASATGATGTANFFGVSAKF